MSVGFEQRFRRVLDHVVGIVMECCRSRLVGGKVLHKCVTKRHCDASFTEGLVIMISHRFHLANPSVHAEAWPRKQ